MSRGFKVHAGLQFALATVALSAAAYAAVPRLPPFGHEGILLGVGFALILPLHAATILRSIALESRARGFASSKTNQWRALKAIPHRVHALLAGLGLAGAFLLTGAFSEDSVLQATDTVQGRYYAVDTSDSERQRVEVTRSQYEALSKQGQRSMLVIYGLIAAGGGAVTLVFAKLDEWAGRP
ncbi:hypothetical protein AB0C77_00365 [Streptomyces sp. NPDC048629]|uniref:hypothetical protein n=1 Tax=Streptomyces sp. NPDC048629 TaxID=3154824 RepID=UPI00341DD877